MSSKHREVREAILDSAGGLLVKYGYRKMTVEDIAREAGISKGTVYLCFPGKEEVALGWFDRGYARTLAELRSIAHSGASPNRKLSELVVRRVMMGFDVAQQFAQSLDEPFAAVRPSLLARRERYQADGGHACGRADGVAFLGGQRAIGAVAFGVSMLMLSTITADTGPEHLL